MTWPTVKLSEVCEVVMGQAPSGDTYNEEKNGYPLIAGAGDFKEGRINVGKYTTQPTKISKVQDIVISIRASIGDKVWVDGEYCLGRGVAAIRANNKINRKYLWHVLSYVENNLIAKGRGATFLQVSKDDIQSLTIPLPPLAEQQRIAAILDKAEEIKRKREQAIAKLDELAQSTFVEMFGDPVKNTKNWDLIKLGTAVTKLGSGSTPTGGDASYKSQGISLIRSLNVHDGEFVIKNLAYIDDNQAAKLANVQVEKGDVLLNITGASVARVCRVPDDVLPARVNQHVMIIRPNATLNTLFLERLLLSPQMKRKLLQIGGAGATREAITKAEAEKLEIICPPLKLQIEFENRMKNLILIKEQSLLAINKHEQLLASLQHQAFTTGFRA